MNQQNNNRKEIWYELEVIDDKEYSVANDDELAPILERGNSRYLTIDEFGRVYIAYPTLELAQQRKDEALVIGEYRITISSNDPSHTTATYKNRG